jgi:hypothetical protein
VELKKKGKSERAHGMCTWYLQTMVVFTHGKVKSELKIKKGKINYYLIKVVTFQEEHDFSYKAYGKV